ncbi:LxmA leader domain family RiPP [Sphaerisporangium fuscum]|uniref:LxmA leader domain family RiPP n=1 Tax=Sphaerisporangium fuscum TaxID=2835868 RepID=UPI001BDC9866|nr:LxmA leader domain family RiPP [Sphaerisporangium fuscum]
MSTQFLMEGADAYTSLAEVAAAPVADVPEAVPTPDTSWLTSPLCVIAYTIESSC